MPTFAEAAASVVEQKRAGWRSPRQATDWLHSLERYVFPHIGRRPVSEVSGADVLAVLTPIWRVKSDTARRLSQRIGAVLEWSIACRFLAADCDGADWMKDVAAFRETCRSAGLPVAVERSRSGNGGHAWLFFDAPVSAAAARQMGCHLITRAMSSRHTLGMFSYDRLFPSQDTLPRSGFSNLIAPPLQCSARAQGNRVFVDNAFRDYVRHGTTTLFAALDIATGQVFGQCRKRQRHEEFLSFLSPDRAGGAGRVGHPSGTGQLCDAQAHPGQAVAGGATPLPSALHAHLGVLV